MKQSDSLSSFIVTVINLKLPFRDQVGINMYDDVRAFTVGKWHIVESSPTLPRAMLEVDNVTTWSGRPRSSIRSVEDWLRGTGSVPSLRAKRHSRMVVSLARPVRGGLASGDRVALFLLMNNCRLTTEKAIKEDRVE